MGKAKENKKKRKAYKKSLDKIVGGGVASLVKKYQKKVRFWKTFTFVLSGVIVIEILVNIL